MLERGDAVAYSWRGRYDRLRLNSSRWFSKLPGASYGRAIGVFPARDDVVRYLEGYAERHELDVRVRTRAERIDRDGDGFVVRTSAGDVAADHVVVATGYARAGRIPAWPGRERFGGTLQHAADYRNPAPFRDREVLVVGAGCSGMEIAYDVARAGRAASGSRSARRRTSSCARRSGPRSRGRWRSCRRAAPTRSRGSSGARSSATSAPYGLPVPEEGVFSRLRRLSVAPAIVDHEWIDAIKDGRVEVVAGVEALDESGVSLADGTRVEPDAVVAATGYSCDLESLVGHLDVLDGRGVPRVHGGEAAAPGLRFVGYYPRPAQLGYLGGEAKVAARGIAAEAVGDGAGRVAALARGAPWRARSGVGRTRVGVGDARGRAAGRAAHPSPRRPAPATARGSRRPPSC